VLHGVALQVSTDGEQAPFRLLLHVGDQGSHSLHALPRHCMLRAHADRRCTQDHDVE
jgi:hypothetical protein